nr:hypothetical protein [Tanacetum cinerariifolium]
MASHADKAILSGADNCPPMLEKDMYDSWKSRMELYMLNRQHGRMILKSVEQGPLLWPSVEVDVAPLVPKLCKNRSAHSDYIRHTQEEAATLREIIESERLLRVTLVFSASGSMSQDNIKKNRIRRTQKKPKKTELEDHLRTVKSSLNKASVVDSKA